MEEVLKERDNALWERANARVEKIKKEVEGQELGTSPLGYPIHPCEYWDHIWEDAHEEHRKIADQFPQILRRALFVVAYARIEALLVIMCDVARKEVCLARSIDDLDSRESGIKRAKKYLTKVAGFSEPFQKSDWTELTKYCLLRNKLVHGEGRPKKPTTKKGSEQKPIDYVMNKKEGGLLDIDDYGYIVIKEGFCEEVAETALRFFKQFPDRWLVEARSYGRWMPHPLDNDVSTSERL